MEMYYKPNGRAGSRIVITDDMPAELQAVQRTIAAASGMLSVSGYSDRPAPSRFGIYTEKFTPVADGNGVVTGYTHSWEFRPFRIPLSQEKILTDETVAPILVQLIEQFSGDPELVSWWTSDCAYVRGSAIAARAMQILGLTQEELEAVVLRCRG